jgi:chromosome segregation ATPase
MSEQYYEREDVLPDTPEQAIENWQAQSNSLANVVPEVAQLLNDTGARLGELYTKAEATGDQQAMQTISESWANIQTMGNQTVMMDATRQAAASAIAVINDERKRVTEMLSELEEAISEGDETHPELAEYASQIRSDEAEYQQEYMMQDVQQDAMEYAFEVTYEAALENLKEATGLDWKICNRFIAFLDGDYDLSPLQSAMLKDLIESLENKHEDPTS